MERIGKYQHLSALARGGSGQLYKAYDPSTDRHVAIKVLVATNDERQLKRFRDEARAAGRMRHPNVISIYSSDVEERVPYLVMEFLEGQDLSHLLGAGTRMPLFEAAEIMYQVAKGLEHAHTNGVIHRDITPQNIWLLPDGTAKIIDFGFATNLQGTQGARRSGDRAGTLHYISPEHVAESEDAIDARSDIFSFGIVFYQLVCGQLPFSGTDDRGLIIRILMAEPEPVRNLAPDCPEPLAAIIHRALQKDPKSRFDSFRRLLFELDPIVREFRRSKANDVIAEARRLLEENHLEAAEIAVEKAAGLVEDFQPARDLHRQIQAALDAQSLRLSVDAAIHESDEKLALNDFAGAIRTLEKVAKSDPTLSDRLQKAQAAWLLHDARGHHGEERFEQALECVTKALSLDEGNPDAIQLQQAVLEDVEKKKQAHSREVIAEAKQLLRSKEFLTAIILLEGLPLDAGAASTVQLLLSYGREELHKRRREATRESLTAKVQSLTACGQFGGALDLIEQALEEYADDTVLTKLKQATSEAWVAYSGVTGEEDKRLCEACGNILAAGAKFCDHCGRPVNGQPGR